MLREAEVTIRPGDTRIAIDGEVLPDVEAVTVQAARGQIPTITVVHQAGVTMSGTVDVVHVVEPSQKDVMTVAAEWLSELDPVALRDAVEKRALTMRDDPFRVALEVLRDAALEVANG